ncbi:MAG TPA: tRNA (uridine(34)/cytosine(34)/5-carboxymethylaminomethyluridine(34)-2'-O)-methyltransferase TrmL [Candidatus Merdicola faecigallinarum]|uniref:Putative tRNA (cytidine(34)-2'-O)-methyltransferase n=1 Tax=Candidatus Merdicola faecigallinarum TaxID=2840862 RepID=A0A9D1M0T9_9FIRM|nr:tRNA (uridine(34)/cytosine(34)/5-carboxymethylaminomethyluridine(34)-2'-O)-methyltransferase TrmL [Candidatus Merdicola faecigallinarum]
MKINVVLVEPEIPQNTGNIVRTCSAIGAKLHLVKPLGFSIADRYLKRAGLDYWDKLEIEEHDSFEKFLQKYDPKKHHMFFVTSKGTNRYVDPKYNKMDEIFVLFGKETKGLPENIMKQYIDQTIRIPMIEGIRCLNLSNAVSIVTYEILRQSNFEHMKETSERLTC